MAEIIDPLKMLQDDLKRINKTVNPEQKEMVLPMFEALQKKGAVFVGQGPTGMGKTYVIGAVTKALVKQGKKVCIAVPSYVHLRDVMGKHFDDLNIPYVKIRGLSALEENEGCPLKGGVRPSPIFCNDPTSDRCKDQDCIVRKELVDMEKADVVLMVFHKLLSNPSLLNKFDVIIFDESHGLEPTVRNARMLKLRKEDLETIANMSPENQRTLKTLISQFDYLSRRGKQDIPAMFVEREMFDPIKDIIPEIEGKIRETEEKSKVCDDKVLSAYYSLKRAVDALDRLEQYRFVYNNEAILGIPLSVTFAQFRPKKAGKETSIALISATIESPRFHANDAGFPYHTLAPPIQVESARMVKSRFSNRPIFGLVDGPILRIDTQFPDSYKSARTEANKIISSTLPLVNHPALILCRNSEDAKSIHAYLKDEKSIQERLYLFDKEDIAMEVDEIESKLNEKIDAGQDIVVTTASSRLWEGVNLKRLRLLIVDALPYPASQPYDHFEKGTWSSWRTSRTFRFMIRRIQQGIGRLVRTDDDPWGMVVVIDGRFNAQWNTIKSVLPIYMTSPDIMKFVTRNQLSQEIMETVKKFEKPINITAK
jgi:Rad3-related DNA helicase